MSAMKDSVFYDNFSLYDKNLSSRIYNGTQINEYNSSLLVNKISNHTGPSKAKIITIIEGLEFLQLIEESFLADMSIQ